MSELGKGLHLPGGPAVEPAPGAAPPELLGRDSHTAAPPAGGEARMTRTALRLVSRMLGFEGAVLAARGLVIVGLAQHLLRLSGKIAREGASALGAGIMGGGAVAIFW